MAMGLFVLGEMYGKKDVSLEKQIFLGAILGFLSFLNFSGTIIGFIFLAILLIGTKSNWSKKLLTAANTGVWMLTMSGMELFSLFRWGLSGFKKPSDPVVNPSNILDKNTAARAELWSYRIFNNLDIYIKGKLQGLTQVQFYGLVFWLLMIVVVFRYRKITRDYFQKTLLVFSGLFFFVFMDPLNLNSHRFAHILTVSPKYTLILLPPLLLLAGINIKPLLEWIVKIKPVFWFKSLGGFLLFDYFILIKNPQVAMKLVKAVVPLVRSAGYYQQTISQVGRFSFLFGMILLAVMGIGLIFTNKKRVGDFWLKQKISVILFLAIFFLLPFTLLFNSNYGFRETVMGITKTREEKLEIVRGGEDFNKAVNYLANNLSGKKILLIDQNWFSVSYYLKNQDEYLLDYHHFVKQYDKNEFVFKQEDLRKWVSKNKIEIVFTKLRSKINEEDINNIMQLEELYRSGDQIIYKIL